LAPPSVTTLAVVMARSLADWLGQQLATASILVIVTIVAVAVVTSRRAYIRNLRRFIMNQPRRITHLRHAIMLRRHASCTLSQVVLIIVNRTANRAVTTTATVGTITTAVNHAAKS